MENFSEFTALGVVVLLIILTDRWVMRIFRVFTEHLERADRTDEETLLYLMKCAEELKVIKESLPFLSLQEEADEDTMGASFYR